MNRSGLSVFVVTTGLFLTVIALGGCRSRIFAEKPVVYPQFGRVGNDSNWKSIVAGYSHSCGIREDGSLWCWGNNEWGQVGDGTTTHRFVPVPIQGPRGWVDVALGDYHTCATRADGFLWCWGGHAHGSVRRSPDSRHPVPTPVRLTPAETPEAAPLRFAATGLGDGHTCGLTTGGDIFCWGSGPERLGTGRKSLHAQFLFPLDAAKLPSGTLFTSLAVGSGHSCGISSEGRVYCWGRNDRGQVGQGASSDWVLMPTPIDLTAIEGDPRFSRLTAGTYHTCGLATDGRLLCWGANDMGQLGVGDLADRPAPTKLDAGRMAQHGPITLVTAGFAHTCALASDATAFCWGDYVPGLCSTKKTRKDCSLPGPPDEQWTTGSMPLRSIAAGCSHTCAVGTKGEGYCWGNNPDGRLGIGTQAARRDE